MIGDFIVSANIGADGEEVSKGFIVGSNTESVELVGHTPDTSGPTPAPDPEPEPDPNQTDTNTTLTVTLVDNATGERLDGTISAHAIGYGMSLTGETTNGAVTIDMPDESDLGGDMYDVSLSIDVEGYHAEEGVTERDITLSTGEDRQLTMRLVKDSPAPSSMTAPNGSNTPDPNESAA
ncbi:MAG: hypothetical protein M8354_03415 [Halalkalicoccus sp.]|nr:hypothetical protein [Halalkalicoccus sp.]